MKWNASTWNVAFSTLRKSHFRLVKGRKISSKCDARTWIIDKATYKFLASHFELILRLLTRWKCDLHKVEKATFQVLTFHFELNFYLLTSSKCDLDEVDEANILVLSSHFELIFCLLTSENATCVRLKKRCFKGFEIWPLTFHFWPWTLTFEMFNSYFEVNGQSSNFKTAETPLF